MNWTTSVPWSYRNESKWSWFLKVNDNNHQMIWSYLLHDQPCNGRKTPGDGFRSKSGPKWNLRLSVTYRTVRRKGESGPKSSSVDVCLPVQSDPAEQRSAWNWLQNLWHRPGSSDLNCFPGIYKLIRRECKPCVQLEIKHYSSKVNNYWRQL